MARTKPCSVCRKWFEPNSVSSHLPRPIESRAYLRVTTPVWPLHQCPTSTAPAKCGTRCFGVSHNGPKYGRCPWDTAVHYRVPLSPFVPMLLLELSLPREALKRALDTRQMVFISS